MGDVLALIGVLATIAAAATGPVRQAIRQWWRAAMLRAGRPQHRYAAWFSNTWGTYDNPYLDDKEDLDLTRTFVSLSFHDADSDLEVRAVATEVLADKSTGNLVIEGAPGSGKSTLLKAYGVGILHARHRIWARRGRTGDIALLVQLRKFARYLNQSRGLADYLVDEILVSGAGMTSDEATRLLAYLLDRRQVLVMLDGLDEITTDRHEAVLEAVYRFTRDGNRDRPTRHARVVVTCRRQNFFNLRDQWVPTIATRVCTLAPLRNTEIYSYLNALRAKFKTADGPESFLQAVRASGTLDLHRVPLVLAMSVGLYARKDYFEIPNSIAKLYQTMIEEMLDRHRFKRDPGGSTLRFPVADKYRLLREFALSIALTPVGFEEFDKAALVEFTRGLAKDLDVAAEPAALVDEILTRSGLLTDVTEAGQFVFAHRSIQEHLAAEELRLLPEGADVLLARATDPHWRQVILFYTAGLEQRSVNAFLPRLAQGNATLAGECLAGAKASDDVAASILDGLRPADDERDLAALVSATISPRVSVQEMAVQRLEKTLTDPSVNLRILSGNVDGVLPLLNTLANSNAARIAALVPRVIARTPDDPRLVEPLWRCLAAPGIEQQAACAALVRRLLTLVMLPDGLAELHRLDSYSRAFLTPAVRRRAYPFTGGFPQTNNLVTVLAWAEYLDVVPPKPNRYYEARAAGRLDRVETDRARTVSFSLFWPARVLSVLGAVAAAAIATTVLLIDWRLLLHPLGGWSPLLHLGLAGAALAEYAWMYTWAERRPVGSWQRRYLVAEIDREDCGSWLIPLEDTAEWLTAILALVVVPLGYAVAIAPMAAWSIPGYVLLAIAAPFLLHWLPIVDLCSRGNRFNLYRPNPFIDMYEDPRSRHWLL